MPERIPEGREHMASKLNPDGKPVVSPGSIVEHDGERRVVVDVSEDGDAVLRYTDDDPRRETDDEGGDIHLTAAPVDGLTVVGHIDD